MSRLHSLGRTPTTIEPGIAYTHAPDVWGLGFTGEGIVVASADTGVRWTHNALKPHYRGWDGQNADHDYNWHDSIHDSVGNPCGNDSPFPCDDLPMALTPPARWSATTARVTKSAWRPARSGLVAVTWTRAPAHRPDISSACSGSCAYPDRRRRPRPTKAPDITNNSWDCPP